MVEHLTPAAALRRMIEWAEAVVSPDNEDFRRDAGEARATLARFDRAVAIEGAVQIDDDDSLVVAVGVERDTWKPGDRVTVLVLPAGPPVVCTCGKANCPDYEPAGPGEGEGRG